MNKENIKLFFKGFIKVFKPYFLIVISMIFTLCLWKLMLHIFLRFEALGILFATATTFLILGGIGCGIAEVQRNKSIDEFNKRHNIPKPKVTKK